MAADLRQENSRARLQTGSGGDDEQAWEQWSVGPDLADVLRSGG
jgi:hypothetical protein